MDWLTMERWSPYAAGVGIGLLGCLTMLLSGKPLGCSTAYARTGGMIERLLGGPKVLQKPYYQTVRPVIEWQWMLVAGVAVGALVSAALAGDLALRWVPETWAAAFGAGPIVRLVVAFLGGTAMGFGARWAGGCTSGHGISGALLLSVASWIAVVCFFIGGVATAMVLYGVIGR
jgi:hypothetical protein